MCLCMCVFVCVIYSFPYRYDRSARPDKLHTICKSLSEQQTESRHTSNRMWYMWVLWFCMNILRLQHSPHRMHSICMHKYIFILKQSTRFLTLVAVIRDGEINKLGVWICGFWMCVSVVLAKSLSFAWISPRRDRRDPTELSAPDVW